MVEALRVEGRAEELGSDVIPAERLAREPGPVYPDIEAGGSWVPALAEPVPGRHEAPIRVLGRDDGLRSLIPIAWHRKCLFNRAAGGAAEWLGRVLWQFQ